jgi:hypothetical protein
VAGRTMLVVGSAPCLFEDLAQALKLRPFAEIMLVNGACTAIENAEHVLAGHEEKSEFFAEARRKAFPNAQPWKFHGCTHPWRLEEMKSMCPSVTDWWPFEKGIGSTSISKAAKIAKYHLGFDEVILCGSPMDGSGYFEGEGKGIPQTLSCVRVGDPGVLKNCVTPPHTGQYSTRPGEKMKAQESKIVKAYKSRLTQLADGEFKGWVWAMSGFPREVLGYPPTGN